MGLLGRLFGIKSPDDYSAELRREAAADDPPRPPSDSVVDALRAGNKILAIKIYREQNDVGLRVAKEAVEAIALGDRPPLPTPTPVTHLGGDAEVLTLVAEGKKIHAIKLYRELHGVGLKEAKEAVEALAAERGL